MRNRWLFLLLFVGVLSHAQAPPTARAAFVYSAGSWLAAASTGTGPALSPQPPAIALYCYNSGTSSWVPADSSCFGSSGGGTTTYALTAAATGGAAPGSTFNGSAAVTLDYHSFGAQSNLSLIKGTLTDGDMCTYTASGTLLNCNTAIPTSGLSGMTSGQLPVAGSASTVTGSIAYATAATASTIVERDSSNNINATTFTGALTGTASGNLTSASTLDATKLSGSVPAASLVAANIPAVAVPTPSASITLAGPAGIAICTGTCTVSVPVPVAGYQFCILNDDNVSTAITLSALGSSARYENSARTAYGTAGTGTLVLSAAVGNTVCIAGRDSTHYLTTNYVGTVTVN